MKTVKEMLTDVRADQAQRQQFEQEQEKKKLDCQQAVALAEKEMQDALARQDQEAYHAAEGRLSYAKSMLNAFTAADVWWTEEEANEIIEAAFHAYVAETKEKYKEAFELMMQMESAIIAAEAIGLDGNILKNIIRKHRKSNRNWSFSQSRQHVPKTFANDIAHMAGTTYIPPKNY